MMRMNQQEAQAEYNNRDRSVDRINEQLRQKHHPDWPVRFWEDFDGKIWECEDQEEKAG
jgi:hypothetical protein